MGEGLCIYVQICGFVFIEESVDLHYMNKETLFCTCINRLCCFVFPVCDHEVGVSDFAPDQFQASSSVDVDHDADKARLRKPTAWVARFVNL